MKKTFFSVEKYNKDSIIIRQFVKGKLFCSAIIDWNYIKQFQIIDPEHIVYFNSNWSTEEIFNCEI